MYDGGTFCHVEQSALRSTLHSAKTNRELSVVLDTFDRKAWADCILHCDQWLVLTNDQLSQNPRAQDNIIEIREAAQIAYHNNEYLKADLEYEFVRALQHVKKVEEILKRREQAPEVRTDLSEIPDNIPQIYFQLFTKINIMNTYGEAGRQILAESRRVSGYEPKYT